MVSNENHIGKITTSEKYLRELIMLSQAASELRIFAVPMLFSPILFRLSTGIKNQEFRFMLTVTEVLLSTCISRSPTAQIFLPLLKASPTRSASPLRKLPV